MVVIANLGNSIVAPVLPTLQDHFACSAAEVALISSGFGVGRLLMDLPAGLLIDRFSPTRLFAAGILLSGAASGLAAFSTNLQLLIFFRTAMGVGSAMMGTVALVMLVNTAKPNERSKVLAFYTSSMLFGAALSPIIGGYLATLFDWRAVFFFGAVTPLISFPLNLLITGSAAGKLQSGTLRGRAVPERKVTRPSGSSEAAVARPNWPALVTLYTSCFLNFFNRQGMQSALLPLYAGSVLGMGPVAIGGVLSSRAIFTILVMLPCGALADRIGRKKLLLPGMLLLVPGNLCLLAGEDVLTFTISTFLISAGVLGNNMLSAMVADLVPESMVGRGMGMYRFTCDLGTVVGPLALGLVLDHSSFTTATVLAAGVTLLGIVGCALFVPGRTPSAPVPRVAQPQGRV